MDTFAKQGKWDAITNRLKKISFSIFDDDEGPDWSFENLAFDNE